MKKTMAIFVAVAVSGVAVADLAFFQFQATSAAVNGTPLGFGPQGVSQVQLVDLSASVSGNQINIGDITDAWLTGGFGVTPIAGQSDAFSERPSANLGQTAYLLWDPNGGAVEVGDFIALSSGFVISDMAAVGDPAPQNPEIFSVGALDANIEVIPEPATIGLMGIAGLGLFLARRKARR